MEFTRRPASARDRAFVEAANRRAGEDLVVRQFGAWDAQARNFDGRISFGRSWRAPADGASR